MVSKLVKQKNKITVNYCWIHYVTESIYFNTTGITKNVAILLEEHMLLTG